LLNKIYFISIKYFNTNIFKHINLVFYHW